MMISPQQHIGSKQNSTLDAESKGRNLAVRVFQRPLKRSKDQKAKFQRI